MMSNGEIKSGIAHHYPALDYNQPNDSISARAARRFASALHNALMPFGFLSSLVLITSALSTIEPSGIVVAKA